MKVDEDINKRPPPRPNNKNNNNSNQHYQQQQWANNQKSAFNTTRANRQLMARPNNTANTNTPIATDKNMDLEIATLKDRLLAAEQMINNLEKKVNDQQLEINNFKKFIDDVNTHNAQFSKSMNRMVNLQEQMTQKDDIRNAQMTEILLALKRYQPPYQQQQHL